MPAAATTNLQSTAALYAQGGDGLNPTEGSPTGAGRYAAPPLPPYTNSQRAARVAGSTEQLPGVISHRDPATYVPQAGEEWLTLDGAHADYGYGARILRVDFGDPWSSASMGAPLMQSDGVEWWIHWPDLHQPFRVLLVRDVPPAAASNVDLVRDQAEGLGDQETAGDPAPDPLAFGNDPGAALAAERGATPGAAPAPARSTGLGWVLAIGAGAVGLALLGRRRRQKRGRR